MNATKTIFVMGCVLIFAILISGTGFFFSYTNSLINNSDNTPSRPGREHQASRNAMMKECRRHNKRLDIFKNRRTGQDWLDKAVNHRFFESK